MRALEFITGHVIYNPAYTYKFQLKTTKVCQGIAILRLAVLFKLIEIIQCILIRIINNNVSFLQELKKANQDLEAKVIELTSTCTQQKEQLSKLATDESGSEVQCFSYYYIPQ